MIEPLPAHLHDFAERLAVSNRRTDRPGVVLKMAMTLDGKIAVATGDSRWVSGPTSRALVHALRSRLGAVMVGSGTVLADDPLLTVRIPGQPPALRILVQGLRPWPETLAAYRDPSPLIVASPIPRSLPAGHAPEHVVWTLNDGQGQVDLPALLARLHEGGCHSLLLEGGARLNGAMLAAGLVDAVVVFLAPKLAGDGPSPVSGLFLSRMADALPLQDLEVLMSGEDVLLGGRLQHPATQGVA